jgi:hypothetical protein
MEIAVHIIKDIGFPIFVALFVLCRLEPAVRRLEKTITALMIVTAKTNGVGKNVVADVVRSAKQYSAQRAIRELLADEDTEGGSPDG